MNILDEWDDNPDEALNEDFMSWVEELVIDDTVGFRNGGIAVVVTVKESEYAGETAYQLEGQYNHYFWMTSAELRETCMWRVG